MRQKGVAAGQVSLIHQEGGHEHDGDDEWGDKDGRVPAVDRGLREAEDEQDESGHEDGDTPEVHSLPLFSTGQVLGDGGRAGHEEPGPKLKKEFDTIESSVTSLILCSTSLSCTNRKELGNDFKWHSFGLWYFQEHKHPRYQTYNSIYPEDAR